MSQSPGQATTPVQTEPYAVPRTKPLVKPIVEKPLIPPVTLSPPSRNSLQGSTPGESQMTVAAIDEVIRYGYGRVRVGAQIPYAIPEPWGTMLVVCVHGRGPIEAVESFQIDNAAPVNVTATHYLGLPGQGVDPWLQAAWAVRGVTYTDTMPGIAYSVLRFGAGSEAGFDNIAFILKLAKCHDPRWWVLEGRFSSVADLGVVTHEADGGNVDYLVWNDGRINYLHLTNCTGGHAIRVMPFVAPSPAVRLDLQVRLNGIVNPWGDGGTGADPAKAIYCAISLYDPISNTSSTLNALDVSKIAAKWSKQSINLDGLARGRVYYLRVYTVPNANWAGSGNGKQLIDIAEVAAIPTRSDSRGRALTLTGANQATIPALTDLSGDAITIECWWQGADFESVFRQQGGAAFVVFGWRNGNGTGDPKFILSFDGNSANGLQGPAAIQDGKLHHVAMVWERNTPNGFRLLVDGVRVAQRNSINASIPNIAAAASIGAWTPGNTERGTGAVQELRVWSVARSDAEINGAMFTRAAGNEPGLVACWHMDEGPGAVTALRDATPNGYDATISAAQTLAPGLAWLSHPFAPDTTLAPGYAVRCDGVDDVARVAAGASLNWGTSNVTLECRVRARAVPGVSGNAGGILSRGGGVGRAWLTTINNAGALQFRANCYFGAGMDFYTATINAALNRWYHLAVVYDRNGDEVLYIDGVERSRVAISAAAAIAWDDTQPLNVGGVVTVNGAVDVDEVRVWKTARTAQEIKSNIAKRLTGAEAGLLVYWRFDEGTGAAVADLSGHGNAGALVNGPTWIPGVPLADVTKAKAYTTNPGLALAEFITNGYYGRGGAVDWPSVCDVAQNGDELVGSAGSEERRRSIGFIVDQSSTVDNMEETLRGYAGCFIHREGGVAYLVPDAPASPELTFDLSNVVADTLEITQRAADNMPTVVIVHYTDTSVTPWADAQTDPLKAAGVDSGAVPYRVAHLPYPGIQRHSEACRMAVRYLNEYTLADISIKFTATDLALRARKGAVFSFTDAEGFASKPFRLLEAKQVAPGRYAVQGTEFQPNAYSDDVQTIPAVGDTSLPSPNDPPAPTLAGPLVEEVYQEQTIGGFLSRVLVRWTEPAWPFIDFARVTFKEQGSGKIIAQADVGRGVGEYRTPAVAQDIIYRAEVAIVSTSGKTSAPAADTITAKGKLLVPQWPPGATLNGVEIGGEVILSWPAASDLDITLYELRYGTTAQSWEQMAGNVLNRVSGLTTSVKGLPAATWRFRLKARDSVRNATYPFGQETPTDIYKDIAITSDAGAFQLQQFAFTTPTLTNMLAWNVPDDPIKTYITDPGGTWNATFPALMSTYLNPLETYGAAVTSALETEAIDVGLKVTADITLTWNMSDIAGSAIKKIYTSETSAAGPWVETVGISTKTSFRFVKARIETTGRMQVHGLPLINISITGREEFGQVTTVSQSIDGSTQTAAMVKLGNKYFSALDLQVTAINTTASRAALADRIMLYPESGLMISWTCSSDTGDSYAIKNIWGGSRTILADDFLEYEVWLDPANPAINNNGGAGPYAGILHFFDNTAANYTNGFVDTITGQDTRTGSAAANDVRGKWVAKRVSLAARAGHVFNQCIVGGDTDRAGSYKVLYRNVRFTNGAGVDRQAIWPPALGGDVQGEPSANALIFANQAVNIQCGPANTFLVYLKNTSDTLVAGDARWRFKGV